jgi:hypothetical protein
MEKFDDLFFDRIGFNIQRNFHTEGFHPEPQTHHMIRKKLDVRSMGMHGFEKCIAIAKSPVLVAQTKIILPVIIAIKQYE